MKLKIKEKGSILKFPMFNKDNENNKENKIVSASEFEQKIATHDNGFFINVGDDDENEDYAFNLFSSYYQKVQKIGNWLSFSNCNPTIDKETGKETIPIEQIGEFSVNINRVEYIVELNKDQRQDLFEFGVEKAYCIKAYPNSKDIYIGLIDYKN